jgi:hypothetical protein
MIVRFTVDAENDLERIADFIATDNCERARGRGCEGEGGCGREFASGGVFALSRRRPRAST